MQNAKMQDLTPKYEKNLAKMLELIDVCFQLKEAYHRQQHPQASPREIREMICRGILARKEQQWTSPDPSLKP
jgi:hypothetical protein